LGPEARRLRHLASRCSGYVRSRLGTRAWQSKEDESFWVWRGSHRVWEICSFSWALWPYGLRCRCSSFQSSGLLPERFPTRAGRRVRAAGLRTPTKHRRTKARKTLTAHEGPSEGMTGTQRQAAPELPRSTRRMCSGGGRASLSGSPRQLRFVPFVPWRDPPHAGALGARRSVSVSRTPRVCRGPS